MLTKKSAWDGLSLEWLASERRCHARTSFKGFLPVPRIQLGSVLSTRRPSVSKGKVMGLPATRKVFKLNLLSICEERMHLPWKLRSTDSTNSCPSLKFSDAAKSILVVGGPTSGWHRTHWADQISMICRKLTVWVSWITCRTQLRRQHSRTTVSCRATFQQAFPWRISQWQGRTSSNPKTSRASASQAYSNPSNDPPLPFHPRHRTSSRIRLCSRTLKSQWNPRLLSDQPCWFQQVPSQLRLAQCSFEKVD